MSLVGKVLAAGLTCFLLNGLGLQKGFSKDSIIEEKEKYGTLFLCNYGYVPSCMNHAVSIGWDTNNGEQENLKGLYALVPTEVKSIFDLKIIGNRNDSSTNDEINDGKYSKILFGLTQGGVILGWYEYEGGSHINKLYYYKAIKTNENNKLMYKLEAIQEDTNGNRRFEDNEFTYKNADFEKFWEEARKNSPQKEGDAKDNEGGDEEENSEPNPNEIRI